MIIADASYPFWFSTCTPYMPVGFAITCVMLVNWPSGSCETVTLVNTGGTESVVWLFLSVTVMKNGVLSVVSGWSVTVLVAAAEAWLVCAFACTMPEACSESFTLETETVGEAIGGAGAGEGDASTSGCGLGDAAAEVASGACETSLT